ncbi:MAG TPA: hypothetical protein PLX89_08520 [Verrucomicrobiota bacterium]|nr:hypothetical protein [Verrucomicrobiales bacterium]HRI13035.1 hypothetical protein [Verrucomicrobiota bacterium]
MSSRILFAVIATFWVLMNVLLWRAEFGRGRETLSEVPLETVVDRLLNAPDASVLQIQHHGEPRGSLRWIPTVEETGAHTADAAAAIPEGMIESAGYNLDLDLNLLMDDPGPGRRPRILAHLDLNTNRVWQSLSIRLFQRPATWELTAKAGDDSIGLRFEEGKTSWSQTFAAKDLRRLTEALGPYAALLPAPMAANLQQLEPGKVGPKLSWSARNDWLKLGRNRVRTYRIEVTAFERYQMIVHLSRAGEILQVKLPDGLVLLNESLPGLERGAASKLSP